MDKSLVVVQLLPALINGGVERGTIEVANYLAEKGHVSIVVSAGGAMQEKLSKQVKHIRLNIGKKSLFSLLLINKLKQLFFEYSVDIVHARSRLPAWLAYYAIVKIKSNKPKFITTVHGLYSVKRYSSIMARGDRVIAVSKTAKKYVQKNYPNDLKHQVKVIYRGIDPKEFPYNHDADLLWMQNFYTKHHQLVGKKIVLLAGRLTALKGVKELKTWLLNCSDDIKLVLTADHQNDLNAAKLFYWFEEIGVQNKVIWVGIQKSMPDLYAISDVVVSPSTRAESFGRTTLESLAIGTPVVGYNHGGVGEILSLLFPQGLVELNNATQFSNSINHLLTNPVKIKDEQAYLLQNMLSQTLQTYSEAVNDN